MNNRIKRSNMLIQIARIIAERSTCSRAQVGCVIARNSRIISMGYNGAPSGIAHCKHKKDNPCLEAVHAEMNAIAFAARYGISVEGCVLYTTLSPCKPCAQLIINAGINCVIYANLHRDKSGLVLLEQAGVNTIRLD